MAGQLEGNHMTSCGNNEWEVADSRILQCNLELVTTRLVSQHISQTQPPSTQPYSTLGNNDERSFLEISDRMTNSYFFFPLFFLSGTGGI